MNKLHIQTPLLKKAKVIQNKIRKYNEKMRRIINLKDGLLEEKTQQIKIKRDIVNLFHNYKLIK